MENLKKIITEIEADIEKVNKTINNPRTQKINLPKHKEKLKTLKSLLVDKKRELLKLQANLREINVKREEIKVKPKKIYKGQLYRWVKFLKEQEQDIPKTKKEIKELYERVKFRSIKFIPKLPKPLYAMEKKKNRPLYADVLSGIGLKDDVVQKRIEEGEFEVYDYEDININNFHGFEIINAGQSRNSYLINYSNPNNILLINMFIALRNALLRADETQPRRAKAVKVFITYKNENGIMVNSYFNLTRSFIIVLKELKNVKSINNLINDFNKSEYGSGSEVKIMMINPTAFEIAIFNFAGGALTYAPEKSRKDFQIEEIDGFICISPPNKKDNCLIECFRFVDKNESLKSKGPLSISSGSIKIRKDLNFPKEGFLSIDHIPALEKLFNLKVCVITGRDEDKKIVKIYGDVETADFGIMCRNAHFSIIRTDLVQLKEKAEEEKIQKSEKVKCYEQMKQNFEKVNKKLEFFKSEEFKNLDEKTKKEKFIEDYKFCNKYKDLTEEKIFNFSLEIYNEELAKNTTLTYEEKKEIEQNNFKASSRKKKLKAELINMQKNKIRGIGEKKREIAEKEKRFLFFDFETVYNNQGVLRPYALHALLYDKDFKKLAEFYQDDGIGEQCDKIQNHFYDFILKWNDPNFTTVMVSYNGARFDNFLLCEILAKRGGLSSQNINFSNGMILKIKFKNYIVIDLCRFVMQSLKTACKNFGCKLQKLPFNHSVPQKAQFDGKLKKWLEENRGILREYNARDNEAMAELFQKVKNNLFELNGQNIEEYITISQLAFAKWRSEWGPSKISPPKEENVKFFRKSLIAGRSQAFQKGAFEIDVNENLGEKKFSSLDVKSLYPFVMYSCKFPIGYENETKVFMEDKIGFYEVKFSQEKLNTTIIPGRKKGEPLNWEYKGVIQTVLSSVDIQTLKDFDIEIEFIPNESGNIGFYYEEADYVFKEYVSFLKEKKTEQDNYKSSKDPEEYKKYNASLREIIKLLLNALSGKVGQREYLDDCDFCFNENDLAKYLENHDDVIFTEIPNLNCFMVEGSKANYEYKEKTAKPFHLASLIYSYARRHMYKSILSKVDDKFFTDTDSCHILTERIEELKKNSEYDDIFAKTLEDHERHIYRFGKFHMGGEFGDYEDEIDFNIKRYYSIAPKCYAMIGKKKATQRNRKMVKDYLTKEQNQKLKSGEVEFYIIDYSKLRFKGINQANDRLFEIIECENIKDGVKEYRKKVSDKQNGFPSLTMKEKFEKFESLPIACDELLFKALTSKKPVAILCSSLQKKKGTDFMTSVHQNFMVKTITPNGGVDN